jgi:hypothetical protein
VSSGPRIPKAELTGLNGAMIERMSTKMFGEVPEPLGVAWHNRKVLSFSFSAGRIFAIRNAQKLRWLGRVAELRR